MYHSTGCGPLDRLLGGGVGTAQVTEVVGKSGAGKTQLCHQVVAQALLKGFTALYIDTTNSFSARRLVEVLIALQPDLEQSRQQQLLMFLNNIRISNVYDAEDLAPLLSATQASVAFARSPDTSQPEPFWAQLGVIVVDSIASLFLPLLGRTTGGHALLMSTAQTLRRLAVGPVSVLVTNFLVQDGQGGAAMRPALGATWAYVPSWSLLLSTDPVMEPSDHAVAVTMQLLKSPSLPLGSSITCALRE
eukprot:TRINITY_DN12811_c0_g1_i1.p2 TRINITY_DN12811_c0_g1~~TRINITY_DN12811_c0_g1_i1.p2  ORF type:complete len:247 (-),score=43.94 TRINITY_DN12811_c0_g1_i1:53-793(-)